MYMKISIQEPAENCIWYRRSGPHRKKYIYQKFHGIDGHTGNAGRSRKMRTRDELPQSSDGKTIMTTEPKFIPKEGAQIQMPSGESGKVRLIDCVGFVVKDAVGYREEEKERMVKTPWYDEEIPFTKAAQIGTSKVIREHSNIGIIVTTDGSFTELSENSMLRGKKTVAECKSGRKSQQS